MGNGVISFITMRYPVVNNFLYGKNSVTFCNPRIKKQVQFQDLVNFRVRTCIAFPGCFCVSSRVRACCVV
jgi:hypothetical protein